MHFFFTECATEVPSYLLCLTKTFPLPAPCSSAASHLSLVSIWLIWLHSPNCRTENLTQQIVFYFFVCGKHISNDLCFVAKYSCWYLDITSSPLTFAYTGGQIILFIYFVEYKERIKALKTTEHYHLEAIGGNSVVSYTIFKLGLCHNVYNIFHYSGLHDAM